MMEKVTQNLFKSPINDNGIYSISFKIGKHAKKICTLDTSKKIIYLTKGQRKFSRQIKAFGIPNILLTQPALNYDRIIIETKRKLYIVSRVFWKWNGIIEDTIHPLNFLHVDNFRVFRVGGNYGN